MDNYVGELRLFAGSFAPAGWAFCDGSLQSISNYEALFSLIGTTYGGDGQNTFGLPDLRGRVPVGQGQGTGLTARVIGQLGGEESHVLITPEMPSHNHPANVTSATATTITAGPSVVYGTVTPNGNVYSLYTNQVPPAVNPHQMSANAVGLAGGNQPHDNTMQTMPISYIIALYGIFPSRN